jgi:hypothetical protein
MGNDDDPRAGRMRENVMGAPNPVQDPAGLDQLANQVGTLHHVYHTHAKSGVNHKQVTQAVADVVRRQGESGQYGVVELRRPA